MRFSAGQADGMRGCAAVEERNDLMERAFAAIEETLRGPEQPELALRSALQLLLDALECEAGSVWVLDAAGERLYPVVNCGPADISGMSIAKDQGVAGAVTQSGESAVIEDAGEDAAVFHGVDDKTGFTTESLICVPLPRDAGVPGCLQALNLFGPAYTGEEELALCRRAAALFADAIAAAGLRPA